MQAFWVLAIILASISCCQCGDWRKGLVRPIHPEEYHYFNHSSVALLDDHNIPSEFNWCDINGLDLCVPSWNQHIPVYCGACWAHGALSMIQNCGAYEGMGAGCDGGDVIDVMHYMKEFGIPDESCMTYSATDHKEFDPKLRHCPQNAVCRNCMPLGPEEVETCWAVDTPILYTLYAFGKVKPKGEHLTGKNEALMQSEIYHRGPIVCSIATPDEFTYSYRSGIWKDDSKSTIADIDHDVEVVGWGEEDGVKYWNIRNSWGTFWGDMGFFKLERGKDALFIENGDCWYAEPGFKMEQEVEEGKLVGSMYGVLKNPDYNDGANWAANKKKVVVN